MADLKNVMHIVIGTDRNLDYILNREIIRYNFPNGLDLWLTTIYNGNMNNIASGCGENTFIRLEENNGYAYGALDSINEGLEFAQNAHRDIVVVTNFDGFFFSQTKYENLIDSFIDSGKPFAAGIHQSHEFPMSDLMIFKKEFLNEILPILPEVNEERKKNEFLQKEYKGTELGFDNVEEWVFNALTKVGNPDDLWWKFERDGHQRYRWTEKWAFGHLHEENMKREKISNYKTIKGHNIAKYMGIKIKHQEIEEIRRPDGTSFSV